MSTIEAKPVKKKILNPKLLPIAAAILIVLALLFMATPLLGASRGFQGGGNFALRGNNGQTGPQNGLPGSGGIVPGQGLPGQGGSNFPNRRLAIGGGLLGGLAGPVIYFVALLLSLAAAFGMLSTKRWGQVLGISMGVFYLLLGLLSLLPIIFMSFLNMRNPLSLILGIVQMVLAVAVIVLASIPAKPATVAVTADPPAAASI